MPSHENKSSKIPMNLECGLWLYGKDVETEDRWQQPSARLHCGAIKSHFKFTAISFGGNCTSSGRITNTHTHTHIAANLLGPYGILHTKKCVREKYNDAEQEPVMTGYYACQEPNGCERPKRTEDEALKATRKTKAFSIHVLLSSACATTLARKATTWPR